MNLHKLSSEKSETARNQIGNTFMDRMKYWSKTLFPKISVFLSWPVIVFFSNIRVGIHDFLYCFIANMTNQKGFLYINRYLRIRNNIVGQYCMCSAANIALHSQNGDFDCFCCQFQCSCVISVSDKAPSMTTGAFYSVEIYWIYQQTIFFFAEHLAKVLFYCYHTHVLGSLFWRIQALNRDDDFARGVVSVLFFLFLS